MSDDNENKRDEWIVTAELRLKIRGVERGEEWDGDGGESKTMENLARKTHEKLQEINALGGLYAIDSVLVDSWPDDLPFEVDAFTEVEI